MSVNLAVNTKTAASIKGAPIQSPAPTSDPVVGNYKLGKTIGQGTYGKVKLASDIRTGQKVAVKLLEKANIQSEKQIARIQREIRFLKLLHHPHIVKVHDVMESTELIYIVMEYATGGELFDYIVAHKRVKEKEARSFFRQVVSALDYCHSNAVIHRDLKPENLLLDSDKNIKIIDFGFGNTYKSDTLLDTFCGSPFYAAPEMILGKRYEGPEVDMWSLGVILFALLCGHLPFDDDNTKELYRKIASGSYTIPDHVPADCKFLIRRMITVDPKKRATLEEIKNHRWVSEGHSGPPDNHLPQRPILRGDELDPAIIQRLTAFGYQAQDVSQAFNLYADQKEQLKNQTGDAPIKLKINPAVTTYYLLSEMLNREKEKNEAIEKLASEKAKSEGQNNAPADAKQQRKLSLQTPSTVTSASSAGPKSAAPSTTNTIGSSKDLFAITEFKEEDNEGDLANSSKSVQTPDVKGPSGAAQRLGVFKPEVTSSMPNGLHENALVPKDKKVANSALHLSDKSKEAAATHSTNSLQTAGHKRESASPPKSNRATPETSADGDHSRRLSMPGFNQVKNMLTKGTASPSSATAASSSPTEESTAPVSSSSPATPVASRSSRKSVFTSHGQNTSSATTASNNEIRSISGWFMNVNTTSSKQPADLMKEVERVLESLSDFGVRFEKDAAAQWVLVVEVKPNLLKDSPAIANLPVISTNSLPSPQKNSSSSPESSRKTSPLRESSVPSNEDEEVDDDDDEEEATSDFSGEVSNEDGEVDLTAVRKAPPVPSKQSNPKSPLSPTSKQQSANDVITFQIEICKVPRLNLYGLHFKRLSGGVWSYKKVCGKLLAVLNL